MAFNSFSLTKNRNAHTDSMVFQGALFGNGTFNLVMFCDVLNDSVKRGEKPYMDVGNANRFKAVSGGTGIKVVLTVYTQVLLLCNCF